MIKKSRQDIRIGIHTVNITIYSHLKGYEIKVESCTYIRSNKFLWSNKQELLDSLLKDLNDLTYDVYSVKNLNKYQKCLNLVDWNSLYLDVEED